MLAKHEVAGSTPVARSRKPRNLYRLRGFVFLLRRRWRQLLVPDEGAGRGRAAARCDIGATAFARRVRNGRGS